MVLGGEFGGRTIVGRDGGGGAWCGAPTVACSCCWCATSCSRKFCSTAASVGAVMDGTICAGAVLTGGVGVVAATADGSIALRSREARATA